MLVPIYDTFDPIARWRKNSSYNRFGFVSFGVLVRIIDGYGFQAKIGLF